MSSNEDGGVDIKTLIYRIQIGSTEVVLTLYEMATEIANISRIIRQMVRGDEVVRLTPTEAGV